MKTGDLMNGVCNSRCLIQGQWTEKGAWTTTYHHIIRTVRSNWEV